MIDPLEDEQYIENEKPFLRVIKNDNAIHRQREEYYLYYSSGVFPIFLVIILFLCMGVIINIGLRIQNLNYDKEILSLNQTINIEKERNDRLSLKVSELRSPALISSALSLKEQNTEAENQDRVNTSLQTNLQSNTTGNPSTTINREDESLNAMKFRELDIYYSSIADNIVVGEDTNYNYADSRDLNKDNNLENEGINFGKIFNDVKDVIMVVSEGILTFFIP